MIHPTALVSPKARLAPTVDVGAFSIVEDDVEVGERTVIAAHVILKDGARVGEDCLIDSNAVISGLPQDLGFDASVETYARIGNRVTVREGSTVNRSTRDGEATTVGDDCYLMAVTHIAHDCVLGDRVIIGNNTLLAGHVSVGDDTFLGGAVGIHQFCRIGMGCMLGGGAIMTKDVPHYALAAERNRYSGLNLVGLRRRKHTREGIASLKFCFHEMHKREGRSSVIAEELLSHEEAQTEEAQLYLNFYLSGKRGYIRPKGE